MNTQKPSQALFDAMDAAPTPAAATQRTPQWYAARRGRFTGSEMWKLMTEPRTKAAKEAGELSETAAGYINAVIAEVVTGITPEVYATAMQWGIDHEDEARSVYQMYHGEEIVPCDFVPYGEHGGGSPDGFIGERGIAEIKCPFTSAAHVEYLIMVHAVSDAPDPEQYFKDNYKEYYWQIQNNLMATGRTFCRFMSYDPRFNGTKRLACVTIHRVEADINLIREKVQAATARMQDIRRTIGF